MAQDTIAAISTAPGEGALAVIRVSGNDAAAVLNTIFTPLHSDGELQSHHMYLGRVSDPEDGHEVDQVMAALMKSPHTYTREDMAEIYCHGGALISGLILKACFNAGARAARQGEFTRRAFLSGRIDITQAEAVIRLIRARSEEGLHGALDQLEGRLKNEVDAIREALTALLIEVEASIDFPDDTDENGFTGRSSRYDDIIKKIDVLVQRIQWGNVVRNGISVVLTGPPNAGKSTLLNSLLNRDRAIVTPVAGTTRDAVVDEIQIQGLLFTLTDTAGLGEINSDIERLMEQKTSEYMRQADLVVMILDRSDERINTEMLASYVRKKPFIIALNKSDISGMVDEAGLRTAFKDNDIVSISAVTGEGLEQLKNTIYRRGKEAVEAAVKRDAVFVEEEQKQALIKSSRLVRECREADRDNRGEEVLAELIRQALGGVKEFSGETISEEILERIFTRFCIGK